MIQQVNVHGGCTNKSCTSKGGQIKHKEYDFIDQNKWVENGFIKDSGRYW